MSEKNSSKGLIILAFTNICSKILSLVYIPLLIMSIGKFGYGVYYASYNVYTFVYMVTISGVSTAIPKLISQYNETGHEKDAMASFKLGLLVLLSMGTIMMLILFAFTKPITNFIGYSDAYFAILTLCPSILLTAIGSAYRGYFQGRHNLTPIGISQFIEQILNIVFSILFSFILKRYGVALGVAGGAVGTAVGAGGSLVYLLYKYKKDKTIKRISKQRMHTNRYILNYIIRYSIPLLLSALFIYAGINLIDVANINNGLAKAGFDEYVRGVKYGDYGNYTQIINVPMILISSLAVSVLPIISGANVLNDKTKLKVSIEKLIKTGFLIGIPSAIGLSVLSKSVFTMIFGASNLGGASIMKFGAYVFIFSSIYQLSYTMLNSLGKVKEGAIISFIGVVIKIICNFILIPIASINIFGVIIGLLISNIITMILNIKVIEKHIGVFGVLKDSWQKPALSGIIMGIIIFILNKALYALFVVVVPSYIANVFSLLITIYTGVLVYINMMLSIKGIDETIMDMVPRKFKKVLLLKNI